MQCMLRNAQKRSETPVVLCRAVACFAVSCHARHAPSYALHGPAECAPRPHRRVAGCAYRAAQKRYVGEHMRTHDAGATVKRFPCSIVGCKFVTTRRRYVREHMRTHRCARALPTAKFLLVRILCDPSIPMCARPALTECRVATLVHGVCVCGGGGGGG
eukprot:SAG11_NODE_2635_length_3149_cov_2.532787_5_plen_158_part_01